MRVVTFLLALLVVARLAHPAYAGPDDDHDREEARKEFTAGLESDKHKDWTGAIDHYLRANDLVEHPFTIYNIATDYERLGKLREAGVWYRRYLDKATDANDLAKVRGQLADLEQRPGLLTIRSIPGGARAFVDDAPVGVTPITLQVRGGSHHVTIEHQGRRTDRDVRLEYGEPQDVSITLGAPPGTLLVYGSPPGATVYIDNRPSGVLPSAQIPVEAGNHEVRVVAIGYAAYAVTIAAEPNGVTKVPVNLDHGGAIAPTVVGTGALLGYYFGGGGGADLGGRGPAVHGELGFAGGHYEIGLGGGKVGDDTVVDLGLRYSFGDGRLRPYVGAGYVFTGQGSGGGAFAGLRLEVSHSPTSSISLLAQVAIERYTPTTSSMVSGTGDGGDPGDGTTDTGVTAIPFTASLIFTYGRRLPGPGDVKPGS